MAEAKNDPHVPCPPIPERNANEENIKQFLKDWKKWLRTDTKALLDTTKIEKPGEIFFAYTKDDLKDLLGIDNAKDIATESAIDLYAFLHKSGPAPPAQLQPPLATAVSDLAQSHLLPSIPSSERILYCPVPSEEEVLALQDYIRLGKAIAANQSDPLKELIDVIKKVGNHPSKQFIVLDDSSGAGKTQTAFALYDLDKMEPLPVVYLLMKVARILNQKIYANFRQISKSFGDHLEDEVRDFSGLKYVDTSDLDASAQLLKPRLSVGLLWALFKLVYDSLPVSGPETLAKLTRISYSAMSINEFCGAMVALRGTRSVGVVILDEVLSIFRDRTVSSDIVRLVSYARSLVRRCSVVCVMMGTSSTLANMISAMSSRNAGVTDIWAHVITQLPPTLPAVLDDPSLQRSLTALSRRFPQLVEILEHQILKARPYSAVVLRLALVGLPSIHDLEHLQGKSEVEWLEELIFNIGGVLMNTKRAYHETFRIGQLAMFMPFCNANDVAKTISKNATHSSEETNVEGANINSEIITGHYANPRCSHRDVRLREIFSVVENTAPPEANNPANWTSHISGMMETLTVDVRPDVEKVYQVAPYVYQPWRVFSIFDSRDSLLWLGLSCPELLVGAAMVSGTGKLFPIPVKQAMILATGHVRRELVHGSSQTPNNGMFLENLARVSALFASHSTLKGTTYDVFVRRVLYHLSLSCSENISKFCPALRPTLAKPRNFPYLCLDGLINDEVYRYLEQLPDAYVAKFHFPTNQDMMDGCARDIFDTEEKDTKVTAPIMEDVIIRRFYEDRRQGRLSIVICTEMQDEYFTSDGSWLTFLNSFRSAMRAKEATCDVDAIGALLEATRFVQIVEEKRQLQDGTIIKSVSFCEIPFCDRPARPLSALCEKLVLFILVDPRPNVTPEKIAPPLGIELRISRTGTLGSVNITRPLDSSDDTFLEALQDFLQVHHNIVSEWQTKGVPGFLCHVPGTKIRTFELQVKSLGVRGNGERKRRCFAVDMHTVKGDSSALQVLLRSTLPELSS